MKKEQVNQPKSIQVTRSNALLIAVKLLESINNNLVLLNTKIDNLKK